jgi:hypothetical protein
VQQKHKIATTSNKYIYGVLDEKSSNKKLLIFVHGFTGHQNEYPFLLGREYFNSKNISTFRFNFYGKESDARKSSDVSLEDHITDGSCPVN